MSTHPNVILMAILQPDGTSRATLRKILDGSDDDEIQIYDNKYYFEVMESDYNEDWQIAANEGDLIFFRLITYGYGEKVKWEDLEKEKIQLSQWAYDISNKYQCKFEIYITANYW